MEVTSSDQSAFSLRPATFEDLELVTQIEKQSQRSPWTVESFLAEIGKNYSYFLLLTDDQTDSVVAGYIIFWLLMDDCHILNCAVDFNYRGLGYGQRMLRKAVSIAYSQNIFHIYLEVRKSNHAAVQLYQKVGFEIMRVIRNLYSDGEDAWAMTLGVNQR